jgi:hypothetical protein
MAFQKQAATGYSKSGQSRPASTGTKSSGTGDKKGSKTTHYMQERETKEYVNHVSIWENESKFEDGKPFFNLIVSEPLAPGKYTVTAKKIVEA